MKATLNTQPACVSTPETSTESGAAITTAIDSFRETITSAINRRRAKTRFIPESSVNSFIDDCVLVRSNPTGAAAVLARIKKEGLYQLASGNWEEFVQMVGVTHGPGGPVGGEHCQNPSTGNSPDTVARSGQSEKQVPDAAVQQPAMVGHHCHVLGDTIEIATGDFAGRYTIHPLARKFPGITGRSRDDLKKSLQDLGQIEPAVVDGDVFLDGRHRVELMEELGLEPKVVEYASLGTGISPEQWLVAKNLNRRNLTDDQRLALAASCREWLDKELKVWNLSQGTAVAIDQGESPLEPTPGAQDEALDSKGKENRQKPAENNPRSRGRPRGGVRSEAKAIAATTNQSRYRAEEMLKLRHNAPDLARKVETGELTFKQASAMLKKPQVTPTDPDPAPSSNKMRAVDERRVRRVGGQIAEAGC